MKMTVRILRLTFAIIASVMIMTACSDDDDEVTNLPLEGTVWTETFVTETGCTDPADNESEASVCTANECFTAELVGGTLTFTETVGGVSSTETTTYTIAGNTINADFGGEILSITYAIVGNTLTLNFVEPGDTCNTTVTLIGG